MTNEKEVAAPPPGGGALHPPIFYVLLGLKKGPWNGTWRVLLGHFLEPTRGGGANEQNQAGDVAPRNPYFQRSGASKTHISIDPAFSKVLVSSSRTKTDSTKISVSDAQARRFPYLFFTGSAKIALSVTSIIKSTPMF